MKKHFTVIGALILSMFFVLDVCSGQSFTSFSQKQYSPVGIVFQKGNLKSYNDKTNELFFSITTNGTGLSYRHRKHLKPNLYMTFIGQIFAATEDKEFAVPTYYGGVRRYNDEYTTVLFPFMIGFQKRLFADVIEDNFRPVAIFDIGPVWGYSYSNNGKFSSNFKKGKGQLGGSCFLGGGVEIASQNVSSFIVTLGYRLVMFADDQGGSKEYNAIEVRLGWLF